MLPDGWKDIKFGNEENQTVYTLVKSGELAGTGVLFVTDSCFVDNGDMEEKS